VEFNDKNDWVSECRELQVEGSKYKKKNRRKCVKVDIKMLGIVKDHLIIKIGGKIWQVEIVQHCLSVVMR